MSGKKRRFPYKKERCLLSDVLPYEIPVSFSNRHLYLFCLDNRLIVEHDAVLWLKSTPVVDKLVSLLLALPENPHRVSVVRRLVGERELDFTRYQIIDDGIRGPDQLPRPQNFMIPFSFKIRHKEGEFRDLAIPHPKSQLLVAAFYDRCKETVLHYTAVSNFTIRAPTRIAKVRYYKDSLHFERLSKEPTIIEQSGLEYESLRSFFVYSAYSNIHKFYESYRYHRAEKKFNGLIKLDISKCFDSIYTHSIGWAVLGKEAQKEALRKSSGTFPDRFDRLMQHMNRGETNGIIIGPEFSRIFAEIILQAVDREVEAKLKAAARSLVNRVDYEIFRYVDDYFVFFNDDADKNAIVDQLQHSLREYKLYLNSSKAVLYDKPIITEITMAKQQISRLLEERVGVSIEESEDSEGDKIRKGWIFVNANALITSFKTIIKTCEVEYQDMLNYTLAIVERKCETLLFQYLRISEEYRSSTQIVNAIREIVEFVFFVYSVSPRVNTTIRLCRILRVINSFLRSDYVIEEQVQLIHKQVYDDICFILRKNRTAEYVQVETLYLLLALAELGRDYWLDERTLREYLGIRGEAGEQATDLRVGLNYFSITVALFYMKGKVRYSKLREEVERVALEQIRRRRETCDKDAEMIFLLFDLISCPFISEAGKNEALAGFGVTDPGLAKDIIEYGGGNGKGRPWFTSWWDFDFGRELDAKRSQEVY